VFASFVGLCSLEEENSGPPPQICPKRNIWALRSGLPMKFVRQRVDCRIVVSEAIIQRMGERVMTLGRCGTSTFELSYDCRGV
jgi:hypothetical protein